ncbi:TonB-dependent siderophore receptor [Hydrocarboniclastica marina]|uniref:TonB-dependent siderophore receptor n=1 Tax=Hydrocarboniclastica marina TaxID=2259620 RepID=A0A4P7XD68_9ALTE|nr:TonB-dependent siderophore receptor [Hydrocarboniclastica marina]MAL97944.1 TonB-dependent siderophore receptor [Alteromonadaceae bacterium]QCF24535.1 TonB-dependent siderophore receptor [Hydrocarboniclastica marina]
MRSVDAPLQALQFSRSSGRLFAQLAAGLASLALVTPALAQTQADDGTVQMSPMIVTGTALKVETPLAETPRPASVVQREELEERNVQSLDETFRYRAGVLSGHYGADNNTDWFKVRGFDQSTYQDGLRIYREGYYQWLPEPFGLEQVELLKGPASILYGEAPPGGVINAISKRPTDEAQGRIEVQAGNRDHRQLGVDTSGPVTAEGDVRYRLIGLYKERDGMLDHTDNERYYLAPSLEVDLTDATTLTILASLQKDDGVPVNPFKYAYGTLDETPFGKVDRSTNLSEPSYDKDERTQSALGYELEHRLNDTWTVNQNLRYSHLDLELRSTYAFAFPAIASGRVTPRGLVYRDGSIESWTVDNQLVGKWFGERFENTLLVGLDYQNQKLEGKELDLYLGNAIEYFEPIDMFDPVYGNFTRPPESLLTGRDIDKQQTGFYIQDQFRFDGRWIALAGVRYDSAETDNVSQALGTTERSDDEEFSFSGGLMYLADNGISPYLSYTESFDPMGRTDGDGALYDPVRGEQWELGAKYTPPGLDGYVSAAVFDLTESNPLVTEGATQTQQAERDSQGFELEGIVYVTPQLQLTAAYTYLDSRVTKDGQSGDSRAALIPRHAASAWADYSLGGMFDGVMLGGGVRYVGESVGGNDGEYDVPSHTLVDLMARYQLTRNWQAQLNVQNAADREYVASCDSTWCYYGDERTVLGSVSYLW